MKRAKAGSGGHCSGLHVARLTEGDRGLGKAGGHGDGEERILRHISRHRSVTGLIKVIRYGLKQREDESMMSRVFWSVITHQNGRLPS